MVLVLLRCAMLNRLNAYRDNDGISAKTPSMFAFKLSFCLIGDLRLRCP